MERKNPIISFLIIERSLFTHTWVSFTQGCFVSSLGEIDQRFLRRRILILSNVFSLLCNYLSLEKSMTIHFNKPETCHPRMLCVKLKWNWSCGSGKDENVKRLRTCLRTDRWRTEGDQNNTRELSARVL